MGRTISTHLAKPSAAFVCLIAWALASEAAAHTTICDLRNAVKFGYGTKARAIVWVPRERGEEFRAGVDEFFERADYHNGGVTSGNSDDPSFFWNQLPQSPSLDVAFKIGTRRDRDIAIVDLTTFSFDCQATEDWRPHWRRFRDHLRGSDFNTFVTWHPLFPDFAQTVGGGWSNPPWYSSPRGIIAVLTAPLMLFNRQQS